MLVRLSFQFNSFCNYCIVILFVSQDFSSPCLDFMSSWLLCFHIAWIQGDYVFAFLYSRHFGPIPDGLIQGKVFFWVTVVPYTIYYINPHLKDGSLSFCPVLYFLDH